MWSYLKSLRTYGKWQFLMGFATPKLVRNKDASAFYSLLGDDVVERFDDKFQDADKPLWLNIGYWKDARTYPDACRAMALLVGEAAALRDAERVLDAGCGFAEQDALFVEELNVRHIVGFDITPVHIDVGRQRLRARGVADRVELVAGSATETGYPNDYFDSVVALESAFHFDTRDKFFDEAFRILKPGGRLALADMLPAPGRRFSGMIREIARRRACLPYANMYDRNTYEHKLRATGFRDIKIDSIAGYTYPGMERYIHNRVKNGGKYNDLLDPLSPDDVETVRGLELWESSLGVSDYVIAAGTKP